jgi:hypothetical protein
MTRRIINRRQGGANARVVVDVSVFDGNIEIDADEDAFTEKFDPLSIA